MEGKDAEWKERVLTLFCISTELGSRAGQNLLKECLKYAQEFQIASDHHKFLADLKLKDPKIKTTISKCKTMEMWWCDFDTSACWSILDAISDPEFNFLNTKLKIPLEDDVTKQKIQLKLQKMYSAFSKIREVRNYTMHRPNCDFGKDYFEKLDILKTSLPECGIPAEDITRELLECQNPLDMGRIVSKHFAEFRESSHEQKRETLDVLSLVGSNYKLSEEQEMLLKTFTFLGSENNELLNAKLKEKLLRSHGTIKVPSLDETASASVDTETLDWTEMKLEVEHQKNVNKTAAFLPAKLPSTRWRVLVEGDVGSGKSVRFHQYAFHWASGSLLQEYELLFHLDLSKIEVETSNEGRPVISSLANEISRNYDFQVSDSELKVLVKYYRVLFLFDAIDELPIGVDISPIEDIVSGTSFADADVWVSSRKYYILNSFATSIHNQFSKLTDKRARYFVHGHSLCGVAEYIKKFFLRYESEFENSKECVDFAFWVQRWIQWCANGEMRQHKYSPQLLHFICIAIREWRKKRSKEQMERDEWPTLSDIFFTFTLGAFDRHSLKINKENDLLSHSSSIFSLCREAFHFRIKHNESSPIVGQDEVSRKFDQRLLDIGLIKMQRDFTSKLRRGTRFQLEFLHESFQNYFAGLFLGKVLGALADGSEIKELFENVIVTSEDKSKVAAFFDSLNKDTMRKHFLLLHFATFVSLNVTLKWIEALGNHCQEEIRFWVQDAETATLAVPKLCDVLCRSPASVKSVHLEASKFTPEQCIKICQSIRQMESVTFLNLVNIKMPQKAFDSLFKPEENKRSPLLDRIVCLKLTANRVDPSFLFQNNEWPKNLEELCLNGTKLRLDRFPVPKSNYGLKVLELEHQVGAKGTEEDRKGFAKLLESLPQCLVNCPHLESLALSDSGITDSLNEIFSALPESLQILKLPYCDLTESNVRRLIEAIPNLPRLRVLLLSGNKILGRDTDLFDDLIEELDKWLDIPKEYNHDTVIRIVMKDCQLKQEALETLKKYDLVKHYPCLEITSFNSDIGNELYQLLLDNASKQSQRESESDDEDWEPFEKLES